MSDSYEFDGSIELDGVLESNRVSVFFAYCHEVMINSGGDSRLHNKKTLYLLPFDLFMLRSSDIDSMKNGFYYSISGTHVGSYIDGSIGDGGYDRRPIKKFTLRCKYSADDLRVEIEGITEQGISDFLHKPLHPRQFYVRFTVPRADMKKLFGFADSNYRHFEETLDACRE